MQTKEVGAQEINELLARLRNYDSLIGNYEQHVILPDEDTYSIKLTNGSLRIYIEELRDKQSLLQYRLREIAARFREKK